ncbi:MAG: RHS repeat-associated core domain-containing protein, partial [Gemmatimonadaceae bacterium]|nr:RHS repeat-associated core domain-containing protein [Gemmatimonadaceae bacterium]
RGTTATPVSDLIAYEPFGPPSRINQMNTDGGNLLYYRLDHNLAYRMVIEGVKRQTGGGMLSAVQVYEDQKGRVTQRAFLPTITGRADDLYYRYDLSDRVLCEKTTTGSCPTSGSSVRNTHSATVPFTAAGDWKTLLRPIPGSTGLTHAFTLAAGTHQLASVNQSDGSPIYGATTLTYNTLGNRASDDNAASSSLSHDRRSYSYDERRNLVNVHGEYYTGGAWHEYDVASAFDARNRRVFKSFYDNTTGQLSTWFFYYDPYDRLVEVRYTPDTAAGATYSLFQLFWLRDRPVLYWQTDYPSVTTSKRYVATDESKRPVTMQCWAPSGDCPIVWSTQPDAWGYDTVLDGATLFQPILFAGQYKDDETIARQNDGVTRHRPGVVLNGFRTYDPWTGSYLQVDPVVDSTWSPYVYADGDPVAKNDPHGLAASVCSGNQIYMNGHCVSADTSLSDCGLVFEASGGFHWGCNSIWKDTLADCDGWSPGPGCPSGGGGGGGGGGGDWDGGGGDFNDQCASQYAEALVKCALCPWGSIPTPIIQDDIGSGIASRDRDNVILGMSNRVDPITKIEVPPGGGWPSCLCLGRPASPYDCRKCRSNCGACDAAREAFETCKEFGL